MLGQPYDGGKKVLIEQEGFLWHGALDTENVPIYFLSYGSERLIGSSTLILQSYLLSHPQLPLLRSPLQEEFASAQTQTRSSCCPVEAIWQAANNTARWSFGQMVFLRFRGCLFLNY